MYGSLTLILLPGQEVSMVNYDVHYALRLCREKGLTEACVQLSALLGLWQSAVDLALSVSVDLAKQTASMPTGDDELTKKLWLKIGESRARAASLRRQKMRRSLIIIHLFHRIFT